MDKVIYIYSPAWAEWSAGTRVLHYLCHYLNLSGIESYLVLHGRDKKKFNVNNNFHTPVLTKSILDSHYENQKEIWVVYSESVPGNPLMGKNVFRWLLNFPSLLGGDSVYSNETVLAYSKKIADQYQEQNGHQIDILFVPALLQEDAERLVRLGGVIRKEAYSLCYAQKFKNLGGSVPIQIKTNTIEISRFGKMATPREETLRMIAAAKVVFVFENSTVITEAQLLGTPVVCVENAWFKELIAEEELGSEGVIWDKEAAFGNAEKTLLRISECWSKLPAALSSLFKYQTELEEKKDGNQIKLPKQRLFSQHAMNRGRILLKQKGPIVFLRFAKAYFVRTRPK